MAANPLLPYLSFTPQPNRQLARDNNGYLKDASQSINDSGPKLIPGVIVTSWPGIHCYQVALDGMIGLTTCSMLASSSLDPFSVSDCRTLSPLTRVLVMLPRWDIFGYIVGTLPHVATNSSCQFPDFFVPLADTGLRIDQAFTLPIGKPEHGLANFNAGRAGDVLPGEFAHISPLGVGILISQLLATLKASDTSRLDLSYLDELVRIVSTNFEHYGAGFEHTRYDDEGEISEVKCRTMYPWESVGCSAPTGAAFKDGTFKWDETDTEGGKEPLRIGQTGRWRDMELFGYLGDVYRRLVMAPKQLTGLPRTLAKDEDRPEPDIGLFEQVIGSDGTFSIRSAKRILLSKTCTIPVPRKRREAKDPSGDSPHDDSYKSSGFYGNGDSHERPEFPWVDGDFPGGRPGQLLDLVSYVRNWHSIIGLARHEKDWYLPQENDSNIVYGAPTGLSTLVSAFQLPLPSKKQLTLDHRTKSDHYAGQSDIAMLDDGTIILQDAYGSQIKMGGGNIHITCPGSIFFQSGKDVISLAGKDTVLRSGKSIDITAAKRDVRIKAEKNFHAMAGNSGTGGILLESRAKSSTMKFDEVLGEDVTSSGIIFKSKDAPLLSITKGAYIRSVENSTITIDSGKGEGDFVVICRELLQSISSGVVMSIGSKLGEGSTNTTHVFTRDGASLGSSISVDGQAVIMGPTLVDGSVIASGPVAGSSAPYIGKPPDELKDIITDIKQQITKNSDQVRTQSESLAKLMYTDVNAVGSDVFIKALTFSLRTDKQYGHDEDDSFVIYETPWQQRGRAEGSLKPWSEPAVAVEGQERTYPWPGTNNWLEKSIFEQVDMQFFDMVAGNAKDRPYNDPQPATSKRVAMQTGYKITTQE